MRHVSQLDEARKRKILDRTLFESVANIFKVPVCSDPGHYVKNGEGPRSLGTIRPKQIRNVRYEQSSEGKWKYRLGLVNRGRAEYWLTVTDLTWRYYCDW